MRWRRRSAIARFFQFAGTNLSREPSRSATMFAAETARAAGAKVVFDVDFRPDQWHDVRAFGVVARGVLRSVDVVIGTEDEINAAMLRDESQMELTHSQVSDTKVAGDTRSAIATHAGDGPGCGGAEKIGPEGARVYICAVARSSTRRASRSRSPISWARATPSAADSYTVWSKVGAGMNRRGLGNACGAIVVTEHGCANFMPTMPEVEAFVAPYGGLGPPGGAQGCV